MSPKLVPEIRVRAYPQGVIAVQDKFGGAIADEFGVMMQRDRGDGGGVSQDQQQKPETWMTHNGLHISENLRIVQFEAGEVKQGATAVAAAQTRKMAGFCLRGYEYPYNCVMEEPSSNGRVAEGNPAFTKLVFQAVQGKRDGADRSRWDTVRPDKALGATHIFHAQQAPDELLIARTKTPLPKDFCFRLSLVNLAVPEGKTQAKMRWVWGGGAYAIVFRLNQSPTVERKSRGKNADGKAAVTWEVWRELTELPQTNFNEDLIVRIEQIAGRLFVDINGKSANLIESREVYADRSKSQEPEAEPVPVTWPSGKATLYLWGVSATLGLAEIRYSNPSQNNAPAEGTIRRVKQVPGLNLEAAETKGRLQGWRPPGSSSEAKIRVHGDTLGYTITLKADLNGRSTPYITGIIGCIPNELKGSDLEPLDITPAVVDWDLSLSEPGIATSADLSLNLERDVLNLLPLPVGVPEGKDWRYYLDALQYNPIDLAVRWRWEDGTLTSWVGLFAGYAWEVQKNAPDVNEEAMSVRCRDKSARFKEPAGILDESIPPLSYLVQGNKSLFAAELIQEIIRLTVGNEEADRLNGNGNARRFLPEGHLPLISADTDVVGFYGLSNKLPLTGGLLFKPPYLHDAASWIADLAKQDAGGEDLACFFYGYATGLVPEDEDLSEFWPVPIYGHLTQILQDRRRWSIGDTVYADILDDVVLSGAGAQSRPEKDYNTVLVVNNPSGFSKDSWPGPGLQIGRSRVAAQDAQAPEHSWVRMQIRDLSLPFPVADVQAIADAALDSTTGAKAIQANLELTKGEALLQWGDLVQPVMAQVLGAGEDGSSDSTIDLNGRWFRCSRVRHYGNNRDREFRTSVTGYTLSDLEVSIIIGPE